MERVYHRYCTLLYEVIDDPSSDKLYLIMEYEPHGAVMKIADAPGRFVYAPTGGPLPEDKAKKYFYGVARGLTYLHSKRIAHRDMKPDNCLISERDRYVSASWRPCLLTPFPSAPYVLAYSLHTDVLLLLSLFAYI
jgi:[calcium/calmodulin-dependent protein kinase] kinase